ncbi:MAG: AzlD domain-containing protein [Actinomycetota bacterium]
MSLWLTVIAGSALVYSWKIFGYLVPERFVSNPKIQRLATLLTVALLAALVGIQTFGTSDGLALDARLPALFIAGILYWLRIPFVIVVAAAAVLAALLRLLF